MGEGTGPASRVRDRWVINTSIMFTELPVLQRPAAVAEAGFSAMESWWPFGHGVPSDREVDAFISAISDAGVGLHALNLWSGDHDAGDRGVISDPHRGDEFADSIDVAMGIAATLGCGHFNTLYGRRDPDKDPREQDETARGNLIRAAEAAMHIGGTLLLEPLSGFDDYPLRTPAACAEVIDRVPAPNLGLLFDIYHLAVNGLDLLAELHNCYSLIAHIQIADHPGRHQPGTGAIDVQGFLQALGSLGWDRPISLEYAPADSTTQSFGWLAQRYC